jgi:hypothetical protein
MIFGGGLIALGLVMGLITIFNKDFLLATWGGAALMVGAFVAVILTPTVTADSIEGSYVWLKGAHKDFLDSIHPKECPFVGRGLHLFVPRFSQSSRGYCKADSTSYNPLGLYTGCAEHYSGTSTGILPASRNSYACLEKLTARRPASEPVFISYRRPEARW